jgi:hypothetical protein
VILLGGASGGPSAPDAGDLALLTTARTASGLIGQIYFCPGSAIFFYLMMTGRVLPRALAAFGLVASIVWLASGLLEIGAPTLSRYLAFSGPVFLLAETLTGIWLLVAGAGRRHMSAPPSSPS